MSPFTRKQLLSVGLVLSTICVITAGLVFAYGRYQPDSISTLPAVSSPLPSPTLDPLRPYAVALLGYGGGSHDGGRLTDTIMVAYIVPRAHQLFLISIPRDVWVSFPSSADGETHWKINAAYAIGSDQRGYSSRPEQYKGKTGGGELAKYAISKVVGFPVEYFVSVNFAGFERSIDVLNGVTVEVERSFDDFMYPLEGKEEDPCDKSPEDIAATATMSAEEAEKAFPCRYEHLHFDAGPTLMDGPTALKYVRSRHGSQDGSDFGRAARQRNLLTAIRDRIFEINFLPKAIPFLATLAGNLETDIPLTKMQDWISQAGEFQDYTIYNVALTDKNVFRQGRSQNGQYIMMPQGGIDEWASVHQHIQQELAKHATTSGSVGQP